MKSEIFLQTRDNINELAQKIGLTYKPDDKDTVAWKLHGATVCDLVDAPNGVFLRFFSKEGKYVMELKEAPSPAAIDLSLAPIIAWRKVVQGFAHG